MYIEVIFLNSNPLPPPKNIYIICYETHTDTATKASTQILNTRLDTIIHFKTTCTCISINKDRLSLWQAWPMTPYLFCAWCYKMVWSLDKWIAGQDPLCCSGPLGITVTEGMRRVFRLWFSCWISSSCFSYIFTAWVNRMIPKSKWNILSVCSLCAGFERNISRYIFRKFWN